jgi:hypothetical protein
MYTDGMENQMMIVVWIIAILINFIPMPVMYKILGIILTIILLALYVFIQHRNNRLSKASLVLCLVVIGWDLAVLYMMLYPK